MAVSFNKTGIINASGNEIGKNYMPKSLDMALGSSSPTLGRWRNAGTSTMTKSRVQIYPNIYGFQNEGIQTANDGSCYGIDSFPMEPSTQYTISLDARIISGTEGYAGFAIHNCTFGDGSHTKIDKGYRVTPLTTDWTRCWLTFTTNTNATRNIYIGITTGDTSVTTQMCKVKLELGSTATPWIPNESDWGYTGNTFAFIESGDKMSVYPNHIQTPEFIEY